jgi:VIT1/CCC1 family predicted Fe2+/Mn2+ transporter
MLRDIRGRQSQLGGEGRNHHRLRCDGGGDTQPRRIEQRLEEAEQKLLVEFGRSLARCRMSRVLVRRWWPRYDARTVAGRPLDGGRVAMRMPSIAVLSHYIIPLLAAAILVIAYFAIFNAWTSFDNPINSIAGVALGVAGFVIGAAVDFARADRAKRTSAAKSA